MDKPTIEATITALDTMGVALASHGHVWTAEERIAYEEAIRRLARATHHA